jgi:hypothetical protein
MCGISEYSGAGLVGSFSSANGNSTSMSLSLSPSAGQAAFIFGSTSSSLSGSPSAPWTLSTLADTSSTQAAQQIVSSTGSVTATWSLSSALWNTVGVLVSPASGGGTTTPIPQWLTPPIGWRGYKAIAPTLSGSQTITPTGQLATTFALSGSMARIVQGQALVGPSRTTPPIGPRGYRALAPTLSGGIIPATLTGTTSAAFGMSANLYGVADLTGSLAITSALSDAIHSAVTS